MAVSPPPISLPVGRLSGELRLPGSKSVTNRALVAAALLPGESVLLHPLDADDTRTLARCLGALGAEVETSADAWRVRGPLRPPAGELLLDVGPAGTPARFLAAICAALPGRFVLDGSPRLRERPMGPLVEALRALGARVEPLLREGFLPLRIEGGTLRAGKARLPGNVSSQFVSALLLAAPLVPGGLEVEVDGPLASADYVELTRRTAAAFAAGPCRFAVEGDDSAACFPIAGAVVSGGRVGLLGLARDSVQPDAVFRSWAERAGAKLGWTESDAGDLLVVDASEGRALVPRPLPLPVDADVDAAPDAALPLAAMIAFARGSSRLRGARRLREKESDRLEAAVDLLRRAGAAPRVVEEGEGPALLVDGAAGEPRAAAFAAHDDHRVAMAAAVLALALPAGSTLDEPGVVSKSWPRFFEEWSRLAGVRNPVSGLGSWEIPNDFPTTQA